jgi:hypothetical protein
VAAAGGGREGYAVRRKKEARPRPTELPGKRETESPRDPDMPIGQDGAPRMRIGDPTALPPPEPWLDDALRWRPNRRRVPRQK